MGVSVQPKGIIDTRSAAMYYIEHLGWKLCRLNPGEKRPAGADWNQPTAVIATARQVAELPDGYGVGLVHEWSGTCAVDPDNTEAFDVLLKKLSLPTRDELFANAPRIRTRAGRDKAIFRLPRGFTQGRRVLRWNVDSGSDKQFTVFELRAGRSQDVLPFSVHPDTKRPYEWAVAPWDLKEVPELPPALALLWNNWQTFEPIMKRHDPHANAEAPRNEPSQKVTSHLDLIGRYNQSVDLKEELIRYGYEERGDRFLSPSSTSGVAGVTLLDDGHFYSHGGSDFFSDGRRHDAFDLLQHYGHRNDRTEALRGAANTLKLEIAQSVFGAASGPLPASSLDDLIPDDDEDLLNTDPPLGMTITSGADAMLSPPKPYEWLLDGFIPAEKTLSAIFSRGGVGKSKMALSIACAVAAGVPAFGHPKLISPNVGCTIILDVGENNPRAFQHRLRSNLRRFTDQDYISEQEANEAAGRVFHIYVDDLMMALAQGAQYGAIERVQPAIDKVKAALQYVQARCDEPVVWVVYDSLYKFHTLNENSSTEMIFLLRVVHELVSDVFGDIARTLIHHSTKGEGGGMRGSGAIEAALRTTIGLAPLSDNEAGDMGLAKSEARKIARVYVEKTNYPRLDPDSFFLRDHDGAWWLYDDSDRPHLSIPEEGCMFEFLSAQEWQILLVWIQGADRAGATLTPTYFYSMRRSIAKALGRTGTDMEVFTLNQCKEIHEYLAMTKCIIRTRRPSKFGGKPGWSWNPAMRTGG